MPRFIRTYLTFCQIECMPILDRYGVAVRESPPNWATEEHLQMTLSKVPSRTASIQGYADNNGNIHATKHAAAEANRTSDSQTR